MKINGIEVTKRDFESLVRTIGYVRKNLETGMVGQADFMLESLQNHLKRNLEEDTLNNQTICVGDVVRVVGADSEETIHFINEEGYVTNVDPEWQYPYTVVFENPAVERKNGFLWKAKHLHII